MLHTPDPAYFADLPHDIRMGFRAAVDDLGCTTDGYWGRHVSVLVAQDSLDKLVKLATRYNLKYTDIYYFPLGSERLPEHLRHHGRYMDLPPGMKLVASFRPNVSR